jgi:hypothetical protein
MFTRCASLSPNPLPEQSVRARCAPSHGGLLERHRPAGGTAVLAGVPIGLRFNAPFGCLLIAGACWKNSQRGFEEREPSGRCARLRVLLASRCLSMANADLSV